MTRRPSADIIAFVQKHPLLGGGPFEPVDLFVVPEPTSTVLIGLGGLVLLARRRP